MARLIRFGSILTLVAGVALHLYFDAWYGQYYYPGTFEEAIVLVTLQPLLVIGGLVGAIGAEIVLRRASR